MMFVGIFVCVLGFVALSQVNSLPMLYAAIILGIVLGSSLGYHMPISLLIAKLFRERRSLAFGIFRMGPGLSGPLVPIVGGMIALWGWRTAAVISGCILLAIGLPLAYVINRIAQAQETEFLADSKNETFAPGHPSPEPQFALGQALRLPAFWTLSISMALRHMVTEGVSVHFVILLVDRGWGMEAASGLLGVSALIGAPARVGMGWLGDLVDKRKLVIGLLFALAVSVFLMGWSAAPAVFTPFMIVYSLAYGGLASLQEPIRADYFGTKAFATIQGVSRTVITIGTFAGPILAGYLYDRTQSYTLAFAIFAAVSVASMGCMFLAKPPAREKP
jgi:MFS family permease